MISCVALYENIPLNCSMNKNNFINFKLIIPKEEEKKLGKWPLFYTLILNNFIPSIL